MEVSEKEEAILSRRVKASLDSHRHRARADHQELDYDWKSLRGMVRSAERCPYCSVILTASTFTLDHLIPTSRVANYSLSNLTVCCKICNEAKGILTHEEFEDLLSTMAFWNPRAKIDILARLRAGAARCAGKR